MLCLVLWLELCGGGASSLAVNDTGWREELVFPMWMFFFLGWACFLVSMAELKIIIIIMICVTSIYLGDSCCKLREKKKMKSKKWVRPPRSPNMTNGFSISSNLPQSLKVCSPSWGACCCRFCPLCFCTEENPCLCSKTYWVIGWWRHNEKSHAAAS